MIVEGVIVGYSGKGWQGVIEPHSGDCDTFANSNYS